MNRKRQKIRKALGRQSTNIEDRRNEVIVPTYDDLEHALPGALSDWDFPRAKRLADTTPMAQQGGLMADLLSLQTLQDTAQPGHMVSPDAPLPGTAFDLGGSTGNWQPAYQALSGGTSDRWRQGLRYAPWNMR